MKYKLYGSSSKGNCVTIDDVMCDIGLPFTKIKPALYHTKYILITHKHGDHVHPATYRAIRRFFPNIPMIGNREVNALYPLDIVCTTNQIVHTDEYDFQPFLAPHNVLCYGYVWMDGKDRVLYTTDLTTMKYAPSGRYDYLFMEANHDQYKVDQIRNTAFKKYGYNAYEGAMRHLSTQDATAFWLTHRRTPDSPWIQLHKSARFY